MPALARKPMIESRAAARPRIALAVTASWFTLGCVALLLLPGLRGSDPWLGWMPFWLVGVPAIEWALLRLRCREFPASTATRIRVRRAASARPTSSRRNRMPAFRAGHAPAATVLTALFVRPV